MPSFDIVSEVDLQEVDNAINQAMKEIGQRYDFKGTKCEVSREENVLKVVADDDYKLTATLDVLMAKLIKRGIPLNNLDYGKIEPASGGTVKQDVTILVGVPTEKAKEIVKAIKEAKLKVQAAIQGESVRVSGKNRDDLQSAIQLLKGKDFKLELQFNNFRE
jgi:cyclic-di-GMP-binding protein